MWAEWSLSPLRDAVDGRVPQIGVGSGGEIDKDVLHRADVSTLERLHLPESLGGGAVAMISRIEDVMEPVLRLL